MRRGGALVVKICGDAMLQHRFWSTRSEKAILLNWFIFMRDHVCNWGFYKGLNSISGFSLLCSLAFFISFALYPLVASTFDFELAYNEGWNA